MIQGEPSNGELVRATLAGDREAFAALYDRYARLVRAVVYPVAGDWATVQDLTQECFLRAYRNLSRLREPDRFGAWVAGIARQISRERKRSLRRDRHRYVGDQPPESVAPITTGEVEDREQLDLVMQKLAQLSERERLAIHAHFLAEENAGQTAELLGLSRSGAYALIARAVVQLAGLVGVREPESEKKP